MKWAQFFEHWELRKSIAAPVLVNLLTALILFLSVVLLKQPIYKALGAKPEFPLYCVAEPVSDDDGKLIAEFYIVNLQPGSLTDDALTKILREQNRRIRPDIEIRWKNMPGRITVIEPDTDFNEDKGEVEIVRPTGAKGQWRIRVRKIAGKAILRLIIRTTEEARGSRNAKVSLPFNFDYPSK